MFVPARCIISGGRRRIALTGEAQEKICNKAFDAGHVRDAAGGGSHVHASQGHDEQQQGSEEEKEDRPNEPWNSQSQARQPVSSNGRGFLIGKLGVVEVAISSPVVTKD
jgi:hypothetical protein